MSMTATANSSESSSSGGMTILKRMIADPTRKIVRLWPSPQMSPTRAEAPKRGLRESWMSMDRVNDLLQRRLNGPPDGELVDDLGRLRSQNMNPEDLTRP